MFSNYLAATLRNLTRNSIPTVINLLGLTLGFTAFALIALLVRDEFSFDRGFPNADQIYEVGEYITPPRSPPIRTSVTAAYIAPTLKFDFPEIDLATRLVPDGVTLRNGDQESATPVSYWADPTFFQMFQIQAIAGDLQTALSRPDDIVLTHHVAQQFFGRDNVVGESIEINRTHLMHVAAVVPDRPANSNLTFDVLLSAVASFSSTTALDAVPTTEIVQNEGVHSYVRLKTGASIESVRNGLRAFTDRHVAGEVNGFRNSKAYTFTLTPLPQVHFLPTSIGAMKAPADIRIVRTLMGIGILILIVAGGNYVSMMTARAARRAVEVGVRKAAGATRRQIMVQFLGESVIYALLAATVAMITVKLLLPSFNAFLQREIELPGVANPSSPVMGLALVLLTGLLAGSYPAFVLSQFRPGEVLKGQLLTSGGRNRVRQGLVIFQFATLIALLIVTATVHRQSQFAIADRLRLPSDEIYMAGMSLPCPQAFLNSVKQLSGIRAASCTSGSSLAFGRTTALFQSPTGPVATRGSSVDYDFFNALNIKPVAGRLLSASHAADDLLRDGSEQNVNPSVVINESAARTLGYSTPAAAIGQWRNWSRLTFRGMTLQLLEVASSEIVGVVPDFSIGSVRDAVEPTTYFLDPLQFNWLVLRLDGKTMPATLRSLNDLWTHYDAIHPLYGVFLNQYLNDLYADIKRQSIIFSIFAGIAITIAALGLLGLAISTAERQTREIGLRKVLGAKRSDILRFLAWQFARPVLWANILAWPSAYFVLRRWLEGFAYHVDQSLLLFVAAGASALVIAFVTVVGHALIVARARPVDALRYE
jgi:putative ABC transport system permease protein